MQDTGLHGAHGHSQTYTALKPQSGGEVRWPVDAKSLQALVDLGMSDQRIADYFRVSVANITELTNTYRAQPEGAVR